MLGGRRRSPRLKKTACQTSDEAALCQRVGRRENSRDRGRGLCPVLGHRPKHALAVGQRTLARCPARIHEDWRGAQNARRGADRRYRSTWDAHAIAHVFKLSHTTVAKVLREFRGPRPKRAKRPHTRRTRFTRRDVMWSSDFVRIGWGWLLLTTLDECSGTLGYGSQRECCCGGVACGRSSRGWGPLVWKYDHGSAFTSDIFQGCWEHRMTTYRAALALGERSDGRIIRKCTTGLTAGGPQFFARSGARDRRWNVGAASSSRGLPGVP